MEDHTHAMTEVSLALAMAFFSIMILAMVSMSVSPAEVTPRQDKGTPVTLMVRKSEPEQNNRTGHAQQPRLVVFYRGRYYDEKLRTIDPARLPVGSPLLLAVPPTIDVNAVLAAKAGISRPDVSITILDERWMKRLEAQR